MLLDKNGAEHLISASSSPIINDNEEVLGVVSVYRDITKESELQTRLYQSQKMESIGQLAGGVAHDFNNILAGIVGYAELLKFSKDHSRETQLKYIDMILKTADRATELTSKLSAFGRKGRVQSIPVDMHNIITETTDLLKQTIDKRIAIHIECDAYESTVTGDKSGLHNSIINLGINAWHAMEDGGSISITTRNIYLNHTYCLNNTFEMEPGNYIEIEFSDTGCGIPLDKINNIFEPFFTTKKQGKGTGLGLSSVYGTVQDHHGMINVYSEVDVGTTFHIFLPCSNKEFDNNENFTNPISYDLQPLCILLVDDEIIIRSTGKALLEESGHIVILAENGREAVEKFEDNRDAIDIIIMDMIMPVMNGSEAFHAIKALDSDCKIFISSGFIKNESLDELYKNGLIGFIRKPFRLNELNTLLKSAVPSI